MCRRTRRSLTLPAIPGRTTSRRATAGGGRASDIADPQKLGLKLWVNGVLKQDSNTSYMIFTLAEQIEQLSAGMTLYPGDIILTGTPAGGGARRGESPKA